MDICPLLANSLFELLVFSPTDWPLNFSKVISGISAETSKRQMLVQLERIFL